MLYRIQLIITGSLLTIALALFAIEKVYIDGQSIENKLVGQTWFISKRGYPAQLGYLSQLLDIRVLDMEITTSVSQSHTTNKMKFLLSDRNSIIGHFDVDFETDWRARPDNRLDFNLRLPTIKLSNISPSLQTLNLEGFVHDFVTQMFQAPRQIISYSEQEVILEVPYLGIVRATNISDTSHR